MKQILPIGSAQRLLDNSPPPLSFRHLPHLEGDVPSPVLGEGRPEHSEGQGEGRNDNTNNF